MPEKEYCLLYEPWIRTLRPDGKTEEVSLLGVFERAHKFLDLAGELPTQDIAVMRLLLAILHAVFARYDFDGKYAPISSPGIALSRWKELWDRDAFPMPLIEAYLKSYEERFYLFHPERPFYQVPEIGDATGYTAAKLNGEMSESGNKLRLFPQRSGDGKNRLRYAEAARWLLYVNAFDDTSAKPKGKGLESPGVGWLGKLGLIAAKGENLFETLLLNMVLLRDGSNELWGTEVPVWEAEKVKSNERTRVSLPDNPSQLLTLQSRRLMLERKDESVTGYLLLGGDFFAKENAVNEQMTVWRNAAQKVDDRPEYHPKRHDPSRQLWRDFPGLIAQTAGNRRPGVVSWLARLKEEQLISNSQFRFQISAVKYGDKDFFVDDVFSDSLSFNAGLLTALGENWVSCILEEINITEKLVAHVGLLAQSIAKAAGDSDGIAQKNAAKEQAYYQLDEPFREWLKGINVERDEVSDACQRWWTRESQIVRALGAAIIKQAGPRALVGRTIMENKKAYHYSAPEAYNRFLRSISSSDGLKNGGKND